MSDLLQQLRALPKGSPEQKALFDSFTPEQQAEVVAAREGEKVSAQPSVGAGDAAYRGGLQGLTFGLSEEVGSLSRMLPGGESPQQYRDRKRAEMDRMLQEQPEAYLAGEVGGAVAGSMIPLAGWASGPARAARMATLAPRVATTIARGAVIGGADAAAQAAGRAEGGLERLGPAVEAIPTGMAFGAVAGPAGELLGTIAQKFGRTTATAVNTNIRAVAEKTGLAPEEILRRVGAGQPLAGINDTTRMAARALKNLSPAAGQQMIEATGPRLERAVGSAVTDAKTALVGPQMAAQPNLRATVEPALNTARVEAGDALNAARAAAGPVESGTTMMAMLDAASRSPALADTVNTTLRIKGAPPLFKRTPQGVTLLRQPTVEEAELLTSELGGMATRGFKGSDLVSTTQAEELDLLQKGLRREVDAEAPQLGPLRTAYGDAKVAQREAFPLGQVARSTAPDKFAMEFGPLAAAGKDAARQGAAVQIGEAVGKSRRDTSLIDELMDPGRYLGANVDQMAVTPLNRAEGAPLAVAQSEGRLMDALTGNSTTAGQAQAMADLKGVPGLGTPLSDVAQTNPLRLVERAVSKVLGSETGLDETGLQQMAQIMMQTGPEGQTIMRKILSGSPLTEGETVSLGRMARAASGAAGGSETQPGPRLMEEMPSLMDIMGN